MDVLVISSRDNVLPIFEKFFGRSRNMAKVYVAVNGERTVNEIVEATSITRNHVSTHLVKLNMAGLIIKEQVGNEVYYQKKNWDELLGLSLLLRHKFGIDEL
ncbi:MAG: winged helix-turn-helix domain-containing protein [Candidatus Thorarchaeota archaeon]